MTVFETIYGSCNSNDLIPTFCYFLASRLYLVVFFSNAFSHENKCLLFRWGQGIQLFAGTSLLLYPLLCIMWLFFKCFDGFSKKTETASGNEKFIVLFFLFKIHSEAPSNWYAYYIFLRLQISRRVYVESGSKWRCPHLRLGCLACQETDVISNQGHSTLQTLIKLVVPIRGKELKNKYLSPYPTTKRELMAIK